MASRSKKKRNARGDGATEDMRSAAEDAPATKLGRAGEAIFGVVMFFGAGAVAGITATGSWRIALGCGAAAAVLAVVLVWRGAPLF